MHRGQSGDPLGIVRISQQPEECHRHQRVQADEEVRKEAEHGDNIGNAKHCIATERSRLGIASTWTETRPAASGPAGLRDVHACLWSPRRPVLSRGDLLFVQLLHQLLHLLSVPIHARDREHLVHQSACAMAP